MRSRKRSFRCRAQLPEARATVSATGGTTKRQMGRRVPGGWAMTSMPAEENGAQPRLLETRDLKVGTKKQFRYANERAPSEVAVEVSAVNAIESIIERQVCAED